MNFEPDVILAPTHGNNSDARTVSVHVMNNTPPTPGQWSGLAGVFESHKAAVRHSLAGFHTTHGRLADGSQYEIVSNSGLHSIMLWPMPPDDGVQPAAFRGFVISPYLVGAGELAEALDKNFLCWVNQDGDWNPVVYPYKPGEKREALKYQVTAQAFAGEPASQPVIYKNRRLSDYQAQVGEPVRSVKPIGDDTFNDVFAVYNLKLYRNAVPVKRILAPDEAVPLPFESGSDYVLLFADDDKVQRLNETPDPDELADVYDFGAYFAPVVAGLQFPCGVDVRGNFGAAAYIVSFLGYNRTDAGVLQTWVASLQLQAATPFHTVLLQAQNSLNDAAQLNSADGWTSTETNASGFVPRFMTLTATQLQHDSIYVWDEGASGYVFTGYVQYETLLARPGHSTITKNTYDRVYSTDETVALNEAESITIHREVDVNTVYSVGGGSYYGLWPYAEQISDYEPTPYGLYESPIGLTWSQGDMVPFAPICTDSGSKLDHTDDSVHQITIPGVPVAALDMVVSRSAIGMDGNTVVTTMLASQLGPGPIFLADDNDKLVLNNTGAAAGTDTFPHLEPLTYTHTLSATSRDFVFADRENDVYVYIECEIESSGSGSTGASSITVRGVISSPQGTVTTVLYTDSAAQARFIPTEPANGIDWGTSPFAVQWHSVPRIDPVFAPKWQEQGACPFIAYTLVDETVATPRLAAHFRLQLVKTARSEVDGDPPELEDVTQFKPYMMERLLDTYWASLGEVDLVFDELEPLAVVLKAQFPPLFSAVGAPVNDTTETAKLYRT